MPAETKPKPSFTPYRKWGMGVNVVLLVLVVFAVIVMVNYLAREYFVRVPVSAHSKNALSPVTMKFLGSLTNQVRVTVYYDKDEALYGLIVDLLNEYRLANPKITVTTIDYKRDPAAAQQLQVKDNLLPAAKNLVIFECAGRIKWIPGDMLGQVTIEATGDKDVPYRRKLLAFAGERAFTAMLIAVTSPRPLTAYLVEGHGEHAFGNDERGQAPDGFGKFAALLRENSISNAPISLLGTNLIPSDCLLIIAGPRSTLEAGELHKIDRFLADGGRLLALFNLLSVTNHTGLEDILANWSVGVGSNVVADPKNTPEHVEVGAELIAGILMNPLVGFRVDLFAPRTIGKLRDRPAAADAPQVEQLLSSGTDSFLLGDPAHQQPYPLAVAVEKGAIKNVVTERGTTRLVVVGDSFCFSNQLLERERNADFASYLLNWLVDRPQLLGGIAARPVKEYRIIMTRAQMQSTEWVLLGGLPGGVLVLGGLVWLRRRR